jgi:hypothetical protein
MKTNEENVKPCSTHVWITPYGNLNPFRNISRSS